jgi:protein arginine N-methyltransferase 5
MAREYEDFLQTPLQPLAHHLESATYQVFEKDPPKYEGYEKAVKLALLDMPKSNEMYVLSVLISSIVVMVVGAGRGPLVSRVLAASCETGRAVKIYAIEKNPSALVILESKRQTEWKGSGVEVIGTDMRFWTPPQKADIVVSELLGSFGDNELSPECLDGALKTCMKEGGICIPQSYTSYLEPISSSKLVHEIMGLNEEGEKKWETGYVVQIKRAIGLSADAQECFTFTHDGPYAGGDIPAEWREQIQPGRDHFNVHNSRFKTLAFEITKSGRLTGFAGYFSTKLYGNVSLSILPRTHTTDMFSWFPIYFPLKGFGERVFAGDVVEIDIWRTGDSGRVWYEWRVSVVEKGVRRSEGVLNNAGGKSSWIGL